MRGHDACLARLLAAKAIVQAASNSRLTALIHQAQNGHDACLRQLLEAKADVHAASKKGNTALKLARISKFAHAQNSQKAAAAPLWKLSCSDEL